MAMATASASTSRQLTAELSYEAASGTACPDEAWLRQAVTTRLGYDPFASDSDYRIDARIESDGEPDGGASSLAGRIRLSGRDGVVVGERSLQASDCEHLAKAMALVVALSLDALASNVPPKVEPTQAQPVRASTSIPLPTATSTPPSRRYQIRLGLGVEGSLGTEPSPTAGVMASGELSWTNFSLGLGLRADLPGNQSFASAVVSSDLWASVMNGCIRSSVGGLCLLMAVGLLENKGTGLLDSRHYERLFMAPGLRGQIDLQAGPARLHPSLDAYVPLFHYRLLVDDEQVWSTPSVAVSLGISATLQVL